MSPAVDRLVAVLRQLGSDLFEVTAEADEETRLDEVFRNAEKIESPQSRFEVLTAFAHELVVDHALMDSLAMRVTAIARVALPIQRYVDAALAMRLALLLAGKLESLDDEEGALALIDQEIDNAANGPVDAIVWRAATAVRLRLLVTLKGFAQGNQIVDAYELDERREADAIELEILVRGAQCATAANRHDAAVQRALLAIQRYQRGDASRRDSTWLDFVVPPIPSPKIYLTAGEALRKARRSLDAINVFQQGRRHVD